MDQHNADPKEADKFSSIADQWWDQTGPMRPLHALNPIRLKYILSQADIANRQVLDIGCGAGILSESLAKEGAHVTGIDISKECLHVAHEHAKQQQLNITYQQITAEQLAAHKASHFDVVTCMEMLEHVPDPAAVVQACSTMLTPTGHAFFSTLDRNLLSYLTAIIGAEYVLRILPKGTHDYERLIRPAELVGWARQSDLNLIDMSGINYNPITHQASLIKSTKVNYIICVTKGKINDPTM